MAAWAADYDSHRLCPVFGRRLPSGLTMRSAICLTLVHVSEELSVGIGLIARASGPSTNGQWFSFETTMSRAEVPCERAGNGFLGPLSERGQPCRSGAGQRGDCDGLGRRPLGWYCCYGASARTPRLLVEEGGLLCDSAAYNDDTRVGDGHHLVISCAADVSDIRFWLASGLTGGGHFFASVRDSFDVLLCQRARHARMTPIGRHSRIIGPPGLQSDLTALYRTHTPRFRCLVPEQYVQA